jgi:putative transcriptional regulator
MTPKRLAQPTPAEIRAAREAAGLSRQQAAELVHALDADGQGSYRTWQNWELDAASPQARSIPLAAWELFLIKTEKLRQKRRNAPDRRRGDPARGGGGG